jgi:leader peptidase (prepilin peptidase)/N-methyltransferase
LGSSWLAELGAVLLGGLLPWLVNGPIVVALLIARRVGRKTFLPFGPAMLAGALLSIMCVAWLRTWSEP